MSLLFMQMRIGRKQIVPDQSVRWGEGFVERRGCPSISMPFFIFHNFMEGMSDMYTYRRSETCSVSLVWARQYRSASCCSLNSQTWLTLSLECWFCRFQHLKASVEYVGQQVFQSTALVFTTTTIRPSNEQVLRWSSLRFSGHMDPCFGECWWE